MKNEIKDCEFNAVKFDGISAQILDKVAEGLLNLTKLFNGQNITIETMISIGKDVEEFDIQGVNANMNNLDA